MQIVQELLGVSNRLQSVSGYSVGACAQTLLACNKSAPDSFSSTPAQIQSTLLPVTDAIVGSSASSANSLTTLAFSATQDPGKKLFLSSYLCDDCTWNFGKMVLRYAARSVSLTDECMWSEFAIETRTMYETKDLAPFGRIVTAMVASAISWHLLFCLMIFSLKSLMCLKFRHTPYFIPNTWDQQHEWGLQTICFLGVL